MSDEKAITLTKKRPSKVESGLRCIVHFDNSNEAEIIPLSESQFNSIQKAVEVRQRQRGEGPRLDYICSSVPDKIDETVHGIHRRCYKRFINIHHLATDDEESSTSDSLPTRSSARSSSGNHSTIFNQNRCIFCKKDSKKFKGKKETLSKCVTETSEQTIREAANSKNDFELLREIGTEDLRAKEARYHESCRREYVRRYAKQEETDEQVVNMRSAYAESFEAVCRYIDSEILERGRVVRMSMLHSVSQSHIQANHPDVYNESNTAQKLKSKIITKYQSQLCFWLPQATCKSELVYSSTLDIGDVIECAFDAVASESKVLNQAAAILRHNIKESYNSRSDAPYPPSVDYLKSPAASPPNQVCEFMAQVISGKSVKRSSDRVQVQAKSFAEDLCSAVTRSKWVMAKHVLLGMSLRHLTGSATVITMLNRFGHCQSYCKVLELDTAIAYQIQNSDSLLPSNITMNGNEFCHMCWDNFDINEETPSGAGTTHTTHGILIQESSQSHSSQVSSSSSLSIPKKTRSFLFQSKPIKPCYSKKRNEPVLFESDGDVNIILKDSIISNHRGKLWNLCRAIENESYTVPSWSGWISKTTLVSEEIIPSTVGYMVPILDPITKYSTVQECIVTSMEVSKRLQQQYTFITFDFAAAKIAYDIVWDQPKLYENVIIHLGAFHTMCSYMGALGKMMAGSGFEEVIIDSGVCASGSITQVMSGSHYNRAMRIHQHVLDALERLLLKQFLLTNSLDLTQLTELQSLADNPTFEGCAEVINSEQYQRFIDDYEAFKDDVRHGKYGLTGQLWINYCDRVWILLRFLEAIKENQLDLYLDSLYQMSSMMFSADHLNYARYLPMYYIQLRHLTETNDDIKAILGKKGLSVARSIVPGCRNPVDLTIEQSVNRSAKTQGGIVGFSRNKNAYYRWTLTRHQRAIFLETTLEYVNMTADEYDNHKNNRPTEIKHSELDVQKLLQSFNNFMNPFDFDLLHLEHNNLICLSSGMPAPTDIAADLSKYVSVGEAAAKTFIEERLLSKKVNFQDTLKKQRLQTFQSLAARKTIVTAKKKTLQVKAERNFIGQLLVMANRRNTEIDFDKLFTYPLSPVPWSLSTADGNLIKTNKAQLMHMLEDNIGKDNTIDMNTVPNNYTSVIDGNALLQSLVQLPENFGELARMVFKSLPNVPIVHFVTDSYHHNSIKQMERQRRGSSQKCVIGGPSTKLPRDFQSFMHNADNKVQLISLILTEWQSPGYALLLKNRTVYYVSSEHCFQLTSDGSVVTSTREESLTSSQEEADTRIILHCLYADKMNSPSDTIIVRSPDTDVFVILLTYSTSVNSCLLFDTGNGNARRLVPIKDIAKTLDLDLLQALPAFHAFTGCDTTSAFVRKGKKGPFKVLSSNPRFIDAFQRIGQDSDSIDPEIIREIESYVCCMYGYPNLSETSKVRSSIFQTRYSVRSLKSMSSGSISGIDMSLLPPCRSSLHKHIQRVNYQSFIWKNSHTANVGLISPDGQGWTRNEKGLLEIEWTEGAILPDDIADVMESEQQSTAVLGGNEEIIEVDEEVDNILDIIFEDDDNDDNY